MIQQNSGERQKVFVVITIRTKMFLCDVVSLDHIRHTVREEFGTVQGRGVVLCLTSQLRAVCEFQSLLNLLVWGFLALRRELWILPRICEYTRSRTWLLMNIRIFYSHVLSRMCMHRQQRHKHMDLHETLHGTSNAKLLFFFSRSKYYCFKFGSILAHCVE